MRFTTVLLLLPVFYVSCLGFDEAKCGELVTHELASNRLSNRVTGPAEPRRFQVLLPEDYQESGEAYPVVYWFPGGGQAPTSNIRVGQIEEEFRTGRAKPSIIVFMDTMTDFQTSLFLSSYTFGDWEGFMTSEVIPFIDQTYRTQATADSRGIMGFSLGGLTSMMLPILAPDTFGAIGVNDPSTLFIASAVRTLDELPEGLVQNEGGLTPSEFYDLFPTAPEGYLDAGIALSAYGQLAEKLRPNSSPGFTIPLPFDRDGNWVDEVRQSWTRFDLLNPDSVDAHRSTLAQLSTVSVIVPETAEETAAAWNSEMLRVFQDAGLRANRIDFVGDHNDFQHERFTALLSEVTAALHHETKAVLTLGNYSQDFDGLGSDDTLNASLPAGWSVVGADQNLWLSTNTPFDAGEIISSTESPRILNAGTPGDLDRSLAVYAADDNDMTIQFLADVSELNASALRLDFDIEAWSKVGSPAFDGLGEAAFQVSAEFDFGDGSREVVDFGIVSTGAVLSPPEDFMVDGNKDENRLSFVDLKHAPISEAISMRLLFTTNGLLGATEDWVFGLDDVEVSFLAGGDFDGDDLLTAADIDLLSEAVRSGGSMAFDLNGDGVVGADDRELWVEGLYGTNFGDANLDFAVDFVDFLVVADAYGSSSTHWASGDFDGTGQVGFGDFLLLARNYGTATSSSRGEAVPEPSALLNLFLLSATMLLWRRHQPSASFDVRRRRILKG